MFFLNWKDCVFLQIVRWISTHLKLVCLLGPPELHVKSDYFVTTAFSQVEEKTHPSQNSLGPQEHPFNFSIHSAALTRFHLETEYKQVLFLTKQTNKSE